MKGLVWRRALKGFSKGPNVKYNEKKLDISPVLEAIRLAPSSFGLTPYYVYNVSNPTKLKELAEVSYNQPQVSQCQNLLVFCARNDASKSVEDFLSAPGANVPDDVATTIRGMLGSLPTDTFFNWAAQQTMIALGFGLTAAADLRIASCPMGGFDPDGMHKALVMPDNCKPIAIMALGYYPEQEPDFEKYRFPNNMLFKDVK